MAAAFKLGVVGAAGCGKSAFIRRAVSGTFTPAYEATPGFELSRTTLRDPTGITPTLAVAFVDAGAAALADGDGRRLSQLCTGAIAVFVCYDITSAASFEAATAHYFPAAKAALRGAGADGGESSSPPPSPGTRAAQPTGFIVLVGCKADAATGGAREVSVARAEAFAQRASVFFMETSAADGSNVDLTLTIVRIRIAHFISRGLAPAPITLPAPERTTPPTAAAGRDEHRRASADDGAATAPRIEGAAGSLASSGSTSLGTSTASSLPALDSVAAMLLRSSLVATPPQQLHLAPGRHGSGGRGGIVDDGEDGRHGSGAVPGAAMAELDSRPAGHAGGSLAGDESRRSSLGSSLPLTSGEASRRSSIGATNSPAVTSALATLAGIAAPSPTNVTGSSLTSAEGRVEHPADSRRASATAAPALAVPMLSSYAAGGAGDGSASAGHGGHAAALQRRSSGSASPGIASHVPAGKPEPVPPRRKASIVDEAPVLAAPVLAAAAGSGLAAAPRPAAAPADGVAVARINLFQLDDTGADDAAGDGQGAPGDDAGSHGAAAAAAPPRSVLPSTVTRFAHTSEPPAAVEAPPLYMNGGGGSASAPAMTMPLPAVLDRDDPRRVLVSLDVVLDGVLRGSIPLHRSDNAYGVATKFCLKARLPPMHVVPLAKVIEARIRDALASEARREAAAKRASAAKMAESFRSRVTVPTPFRLTAAAGAAASPPSPPSPPPLALTDSAAAAPTRSHLVDVDSGVAIPAPAATGGVPAAVTNGHDALLSSSAFSGASSSASGVSAVAASLEPQFHQAATTAAGGTTTSPSNPVIARLQVQLGPGRVGQLVIHAADDVDAASGPVARFISTYGVRDPAVAAYVHTLAQLHLERGRALAAAAAGSAAAADATSPTRTARRASPSPERARVERGQGARMLAAAAAALDGSARTRTRGALPALRTASRSRSRLQAGADGAGPAVARPPPPPVPPDASFLRPTAAVAAKRAASPPVARRAGPAPTDAHGSGSGAPDTAGIERARARFAAQREAAAATDRHLVRKLLGKRAVSYAAAPAGTVPSRVAAAGGGYGYAHAQLVDGVPFGAAHGGADAGFGGGSDEGGEGGEDARRWVSDGAHGGDGSAGGWPSEHHAGPGSAWPAAGYGGEHGMAHAADVPGRRSTAALHNDDASGGYGYGGGSGEGGDGDGEDGVEEVAPYDGEALDGGYGSELGAESWPLARTGSASGAGWGNERARGHSDDGGGGGEAAHHHQQQLPRSLSARSHMRRTASHGSIGSDGGSPPAPPPGMPHATTDGSFAVLAAGHSQLQRPGSQRSMGSVGGGGTGGLSGTSSQAPAPAPQPPPGMPHAHAQSQPHRSPTSRRAASMGAMFAEPLAASTAPAPATAREAYEGATSGAVPLSALPLPPPAPQLPSAASLSRLPLGRPPSARQLANIAAEAAAAAVLPSTSDGYALPPGMSRSGSARSMTGGAALPKVASVPRLRAADAAAVASGGLVLGLTPSIPEVVSARERSSSWDSLPTGGSGSTRGAPSRASDAIAARTGSSLAMGAGGAASTAAVAAASSEDGRGSRGATGSRVGGADQPVAAVASSGDDGSDFDDDDGGDAGMAAYMAGSRGAGAVAGGSGATTMASPELRRIATASGIAIDGLTTSQRNLLAATLSASFRGTPAEAALTDVSDGRALFNLDVDIGGGRKGRIVVRERASAESLAAAFIAAHGLPPQVQPRLVSLISSSREAQLRQVTTGGASS